MKQRMADLELKEEKKLIFFYDLEIGKVLSSTEYEMYDDSCHGSSIWKYDIVVDGIHFIRYERDVYDTYVIAEMYLINSFKRAIINCILDIDNINQVAKEKIDSITKKIKKYEISLSKIE